MAKSEKIRLAYDKLKTELVTYWDKPRAGEFLSNKQFILYCCGGMGINVFNTTLSLLSFGANWFCGDLYGITVKDFVTINLIGMVLNYLFLFMSPIGMLIYENHGVLDKKEKLLLNVVTISKIVVGIALYFVPSEPFNGIISGLPKLIANMLVIGGVNEYVNWFVRLKWCSKHGRVKPFVIFGAVPAVIMFSIIPWLPYNNFDYEGRLVLLHAVFSFAGWYSGAFVNYGNMTNFLTQNTQERQRIISLSPILTNVITSVIGILFPIIITKTTVMGQTLTGYDDLWVYKIFCPLFAIISLVGVICMIPVKENLIERRVDRPKVQFFKGARQVFSNKYLWISNISGVLGCISGMIGNVITWWMMYILRETWATGLAMSFTYLGGTVGNILTPIITKKMDKIRVYKIGRLLQIVFLVIQFLLFRASLMWVFIGFIFFVNILGSVVGGIGNSTGGDVMDYHQWRFGERCDSVAGVFGWFTNPITQAIGYLAPYVYQMAGYTSDWGVLYDEVIFNNLFIKCFYLSIIGTTLSTIPYLFYDLTAEKHRGYVEELRERVRIADIAEIERRRADGTLSELSPALLSQYGYGSDGILLPSE